MEEIGPTKSLLSKFGISTQGYDDKDIESVIGAVSEAQSDFGMIRLRLGALLLAVKQKEMWRGRAASFNEYLESEKIKLSAANQYMKVAEKLLFEFKISDEQLKAISKCSMTTLVKATQMMTRKNKDEVISLLDTLSDRDANHSIANFEEHQKPLQEPRKTGPAAQRVLNEFFRLPNDERINVIRQIGGHSSSILAQIEKTAASTISS